MKSFKLIIFIIVLSIFSIFTINIKMLASIGARGNLVDQTVSYPNNLVEKLNPLKEKLKINEDITIDNLNIDTYSVYQPTQEIYFSGNFKVGNTIFELTLFNLNKVDLSTWINQNFPQTKNNEDNFSEKYSRKLNINFNSDTKRIVAKVDNRYFVYYFKQVSDKVLSIGFQLGNYQPKDIDNILSAVKVKQSNFYNDNQKVKDDLNKSILDINEYNKGLKNNINLNFISFTSNKVLADTSIYYLPWESGQAYSVTQDWGANDNPPCTNCSHVGLSGYAYDFGMSEGTILLASAAGTVTYVKSGETTCGNTSYINNANYVVINHSDGKATEYHHLKTVNVKVGDVVVHGQQIGTSGHTGYTVPAGGTDCQDHLHFQKQAQGGAYTQSEAFFFEEYPTESVDGELKFPNSYISQNIKKNGTDPCASSIVVLNSVQSNLYCAPTDHIMLFPGATINPESDLHIQ